MDVRGLNELIRRGDDSCLQCKLKFDSVDQLTAELCAFSNSEGRRVLVGVTDLGDIIGLDRKQLQKLNQDISNACSQKVDPPISVVTTNVLHGNDVVVLIEIPRGV